MNFKHMLKESKITQQTLANALNITQQLVSKWINEKCTPDPTMILLIAKELNRSTDDILNCFNKKAAI